MTAKKAAGRKKPARKKKSEASRAATRAAMGVTPRVNPPLLADVIAEREENAELWAEAWRMKTIGLSSRRIGEAMNVSHVTALEYAAKHEVLIAGDPMRISEKVALLARLDHMADNMAREITQLDAEERKKPVGDRQPVWLRYGDPLLRVLQTKWRIVAPNDDGKSVRVELGASVASGSGVGGPLEMPAAVQAVVASVTISGS